MSQGARRTRALFRANRDLRILRSCPLDGISVQPLENEPLVWHANFMLSGVSMHFELYIPETYPMHPPRVFFATGLPHPSCLEAQTPDGRSSYRVCLDILGDTQEIGSGWSSAYDMRGLLLQLQAFILDHRAQYKRVASLTQTEAVRRAVRYACPHCTHAPGKPSPCSQVATFQQQLTLLKALAPRRMMVSLKMAAIPICAIARIPPQENQKWRDVQRFATHCMVKRSVPQLVAVTLTLPDGFILVKKGKGAKMVSQCGAQLSLEERKHAKAIQIQKAIRGFLCRCLANSLRRIRILGYMPGALQDAFLKLQSISRDEISVRAEMACKAESQTKEWLSQGWETRVAQVAFASFLRRKRALEKKMRQISDLESCQTLLSKEQIQKLRTRVGCQRELDRLISPAKLPVVLHHLATEFADPITVGFCEAFEEARLQDKDNSTRLKQKVRKDRRLICLKARAQANSISRLQRAIDIARESFVNDRWQVRFSQFTIALPELFSMWSKVAKTKIDRNRKIDCNRNLFRDGVKSGVFRLELVPYSVQVGILLKMLCYIDLLPLTCSSKKMRLVSEDGCLWASQMSRHHPLSVLTAESMKDWKYTFLCEVNQVVADLQCFHTKQSIQDSGVILGIPIEFSINPRKNETDYIYSSMDYLSHDAFAIDGVRTTVYKEEFSQWLPMYFSEEHWQRALPFIMKSVPKILNQGRFHPSMTLTIFTKMVNTLIVLICDKGVSFSDRAVKAFCVLQRWALRCIEQWPGLQKEVDDRIGKFCSGQKYRGKDVEPNLGEFLALLVISTRSRKSVAPHVMAEWLDRQVLWICQEHPCLENIGDRGALSDADRIQKTWEAAKVGKRLQAFHGICFSLFCDRSFTESVYDSDIFYGQPRRDLVARFAASVGAVLAMSSWPDFFKIMEMALPTRAKLAEMLRNAVRNSRKRGYHTAGMDFNRVHASGTSKILRKGESYMAAATLDNIVLEEHWSWADQGVKYLDASLFAYDGKHMVLGHVDYSQQCFPVTGKFLPSSVMLHSGDQLDHVKDSGFHEINVSLNSLPNHFQYLYITVSSWNGALLKDIKRPSVRLVSADGEELCRYDVEGADGDKTSILMCVLQRRVERSTASVSRWSLEAIGDVGMGSASNYGPINATIENFRVKKGW